MDLPPARLGELAVGEVADLDVGEREVGRVALRVRKEETGLGCRAQRVSEILCGVLGQAAPGAGRASARGPGRPGATAAEPRPDRPQVAQAEAPTEHGSVGECLASGRRQSRRPALDQRPNCRGHEPRRVPAQLPATVDLLERARLAVRSSELLDDERNALGLDLHRRGRGGLDRPAEHVLEELRGLDLAEARRSQAADEPHPLHVCHEVDRLGHCLELGGPDREEQEDRPVGVAAHDVSEHSQGVVIGPLDVIDEQGEGANVGNRADGNAGEVEGAQELGLGERLAKPALSRPDIASTTRRTAASAGVPAAVSRIAGAARRLRATRNGPRISSSAVTAITVKPAP